MDRTPMIIVEVGVLLACLGASRRWDEGHSLGQVARVVSLVFIGSLATLACLEVVR